MGIGLFLKGLDFGFQVFDTTVLFLDDFADRTVAALVADFFVTIRTQIHNE